MTGNKRLEELLAEIQLEIGSNKTEKPKVGELWKAWETGMVETKSLGTAQSLRSSGKHLLPYIGEMTLDQITGEWWTNTFIPAKRKETRPGFKFFNIKKWLGMFLKWCDENRKGGSSYRRPRLIDPDPERAKGKAYSIQQTDALLANADWLLKPKLVMALFHFMRRSEIALLSKDRVDRVNRVIHLRAEDTKIRKARSFPYSQMLEDLFVIMDQEHEKRGIVSPYVFPSPINHMKSIGRDGFASAWATCKRCAYL